MAADRHLEILMAVQAIAKREDEKAGVRHVCLACGLRTNATGAAVYLLGDAGSALPLETTGQVGEQIAELQVTLGEGPVSEALRQNQPVLVPHLEDSASAKRWPVFAPAAVAAGVAAVFVIPLTLGAISLGALEICRDTGSPLTPDELTDVLLFADTAMTLLLDKSAGSAAWDTGNGARTEPDRRWGVVHQATGMVSVQLDTDLAEAFLRLRAHSYLTGRRLSDVATEVVARTLRFAPENNDEKLR